MFKSVRFILVLSALSAVSSLAQPAPKLNSLSREWFQRGTTAELTVNGENLAGARELIISGAPGLKAAIIPTAAPNLQVESSAGGISSVAPVESGKLKVKLEIDNTAALTEREVRLVGPHGVSNPLTVRLSQLPEIDASANESKDKAQEIALPAVISGTINTAAESHFYRFSGKKGEHVILDVNAFRLGSKLDSSLAVYDHAGKELARSEDAILLDSVLDFTVPEDGEYIAELRDFRYQGAGDYKYRLTIGVLPYVARSFPYGAQRGQEVPVQLRGANLEGASKIVLSIAPDAALGRQEIRTGTSRGLSNPFPLELTDLPSRAETEPNSALDQADLISIPSAIDGKIGKERDYDAFKFSAAKNQKIVFEAAAFRFGSALDALLILTDATGQELRRNDDAAATDARIDYTFNESGDYYLVLEDLLNRGGEDFGYRLTATVPQPDFSVAVLSDTPRLRIGGRVPVRCEVTRINGFDAPVKIACEGLPSGVYAEPLVLAPGVSAGFMVLIANEAATLGSSPLKIIASAGAMRKEVAFFSGDKQVQAGFVSIIERAPFSIASATLMSQIEQNQSESIEVLVERRDGFEGEIKITPEGFSAGRDPISKSFEFQPLTIKPNEQRGALTLKGKLDSEIGVRHMVLRGEAQLNGHTTSAFSSLIPLATAQIPYVLTTSLKKLIVTALPSDSGSAASEAVFLVKADRRMGFTNEIALKIEGLPEGITATAPNILANEKEATIRLVASEKAPPGKDLSLTISGAGLHQDRNYRFSAPAVTLTINAPEVEKEPKLANTEP